MNNKINLDELYTLLDLKTQAAREFLRLVIEDTLLFDKKQSDYGSKNISDWGAFGVIVRMSDKFSRVKNLYRNRRKASINEFIRDNMQDIGIYSRIFRMLDEGKWPDE